MKIRIYSPFFPFPVTEGAYLVVADQLRYFSQQGHDVELVCWWPNRASTTLEVAGSECPPRVRCILLGRGTESTWQRRWRVARSVCSRFASPELFFYPPALLKKVRALGSVDLAIYHYTYAHTWLSRPSRLPAESKRVVHVHNLESAGHADRGGLLDWLHRWNAGKLRTHEGTLAAEVDELWFLSPLDGRALGHPNARVIPPTFDPGLKVRRQPSGGQQAVAGFIGVMDFRPNYASALWILRELAPLLAAAGYRGKLVFVGKAMPEDLKQLARRYPFIELRGFVESLHGFWAELSFLLAPHITGTGIRTKILESIVSGVPVLTNTAGAEPLPDGARRSPFLLCHDDPAEWARILLSETRAQATRDRLADEPVCAALTAEEVYADVG